MKQTQLQYKLIINLKISYKPALIKRELSADYNGQ